MNTTTLNIETMKYCPHCKQNVKTIVNATQIASDCVSYEELCSQCDFLIDED